jgi:hypothetical protein
MYLASDLEHFFDAFRPDLIRRFVRYCAGKVSGLLKFGKDNETSRLKIWATRPVSLCMRDFQCRGLHVSLCDKAGLNVGFSTEPMVEITPKIISH